MKIGKSGDNLYVSQVKVKSKGNHVATTEIFPYDVAVLGGGSAGYAAARTAAAAGLRTVVIEGGAEVGGLCILRGCMPSKALLYAAEVLHLARQGKTWGLRIPKAGFDFARRDGAEKGDGGGFRGLSAGSN